MFGDRRAHFPAFIAVEPDHALGLGTVAQTLVRQDFLQDRLPIGRRILPGTEQLLRVKCKLIDLRGELRTGGGFRQVLPFLQGGQSREDILEHAGSRARSGHELALSVDLRAFVVADGSIGLRLGEDADSTLRGGRTHDLHPGEPLLEMVDLLLDGVDGGSSLLDLVDVFLVEHSLSVCFDYSM